VDSAEPEFPRPAGFWWFGCSSIQQGIVTTPSTTTSTERSNGGGKWFFPFLNDDPDDNEVVISGEADHHRSRGIWRRVRHLFKVFMGKDRDENHVGVGIVKVG
jgi:selenocysteine lyase/cysteine desulfurase